MASVSPDNSLSLTTPRSPIPASLREAIKTVYRGKCQYCDSENGNEIEHIEPLAKGGADTLDNFTLACRKCNSKKASYVLPDAYKGILLARAEKKAPEITALVQRLNPGMTPEQCKMARAGLGWSVQKLGKLAQMTPNTVSRFENGKDSYTSTSYKLEQALEAGDQNGYIEFSSTPAPGVHFHARENSLN